MPLSLSAINDSAESNEEVDELADDSHDDSVIEAAFIAGSELAEAPDVDDTASGGKCYPELTGKCEHCSVPLGNGAEDSGRVFRCINCDNLECETCCHTIHVYHQKHLLLEWTAARGEWKQVTFRSSKLSEKYPTLCGACDTVIAAAGTVLPLRTVLCDECGDGPVCQDCCITAHAAAPLHMLKSWNGHYWEPTTLRQQGFVYQMGHGVWGGVSAFT
ncbi:hypothetical protein C8F04DRAFT_1268559 [Mycena alexandri]|uniref:Uncharacterized protein n=1 Tax=Mycena alexandri TaxID=1745969 RepID=A0AAD6SF61_9AGAR|nr:hypothetical protein C8F04DRAFT_1268559 [Mycena alexandri]